MKTKKNKVEWKNKRAKEKERAVKEEERPTEEEERLQEEETQAIFFFKAGTSVCFWYTYVTGSRKRDNFADLLESRYRHLNSDNNNKTFFADLSFLLANGSRIFPLPLYQF